MSKMSEIDMDRQRVERSEPDVLEKLIADVKATVKETSAKVAEINRIARPENEFQHGYNAAVADIAAMIRAL